MYIFGYLFLPAIDICFYGLETSPICVDSSVVFLTRPITIHELIPHNIHIISPIDLKPPKFFFTEITSEADYKFWTN